MIYPVYRWATGIIGGRATSIQSIKVLAVTDTRGQDFAAFARLTRSIVASA